MLADEFDLCEGAVHYLRFIHCAPVRSGNSEQSCRTFDHADITAIAVVGYSVPLVANAEVECQAGIHLEIVFEEPAEFTFLPMTPFVKPRREHGIWWIRRIECLVDTSE